jgi:hypothetical protein
MHLSGLDLTFWALTFFLNCALLAILVLRRRAAAFPIFTTLIFASVIRTIILYVTYRFASANTYFYIFWSLGFLDLSLQLAVAYELASTVFRPIGFWAHDVRRSAFLAVGISLALAILLTVLASPATHTLRSSIVIRGNFFSSALMSELFVVMVALSVYIGLPWKTHVARIAQGFGVYSLFGLFTEAAHSYFGTGNHAYARISQVRIALYCVCVLYWSIALLRDEPQPSQLPESMKLQLRALQLRTSALLQNLRESRRPS